MNGDKYISWAEAIEQIKKQAADEKARDEQRRQNEVEAREQELRQLFLEDFAELAHEQWSGWMQYLFSKGTFNEDGTWTMPAWAVKRWQRQMNTDYADLSQSEQDSDRTEANKFLDVVRPWLI